MGIKFEEKPQMGQRFAKHQMQSGVRLYHQRHYQQAIGRWRTALHRLRSAEDRFVTLGYLAQAFGDAGDYESMLHFALQQMELANSRNDDFMKSEAFLNLSKAYERLSDYSKAISYGRASLQHPNIDSRTPGYAHLAIAMAQLGFSQLQSSLESFEKAMSIANTTGDKLLELQVCVGLGALFTLLRDLNKALIFLRNALSILQLVSVDNVHAKYKSAILYHLSVVLRHKGSLTDAREACEEALKLSQQTGNRAIYARSLCSMADINRELGESEAKETITKSWARYEQSFRVMRQIHDRMGEVMVLGSMAKSASESRSHYTGQCECQAIQLNKKCLELATLIGCKHAMMKCHFRLQELYAQLADEDSEEAAGKSCISLIQEMELFCNFCGQRYGAKPDSLQALRCSHIFHEKCLHRFLAEGNNQSCPKCQCKAVVMENISIKTASSAASEHIEIKHTTSRRPILLDTAVATDTDADDEAVFHRPHAGTPTFSPVFERKIPNHIPHNLSRTRQMTSPPTDVHCPENSSLYISTFSSVDNLPGEISGTAAQIGMKSPRQELSLSASTSSVVFPNAQSVEMMKEIFRSREKVSVQKNIPLKGLSNESLPNAIVASSSNRTYATRNIKLGSSTDQPSTSTFGFLTKDAPNSICQQPFLNEPKSVNFVGDHKQKPKLPPPLPMRNKPSCRTDAFPAFSEELLGEKTEKRQSKEILGMPSPVFEEQEGTPVSEEKKETESNESEEDIFVVSRGPGVTDV
ncbi:tetratricopeptide repeat domain-containing protein [Ditylenchus destructor]|nr:tetratricopeptide repeat domain-containing protein [Ditylenchus destructor]